jgi:LAO/AO transport system kinase
MGFSSSDLKSDRLSLARTISAVENNTPAGKKALDETFADSGKAYLVGVTGAPGTGKSTLVSRLALWLRKEQGLTVAIVAIDPTSPFTGGAILGDRVRMRDLAGDEGVFIRSMATRGELGGLALTTAGVVQILDAAGYQMILIETVGAGQSEVEIARLAHTTLVVESPGMGDDIQAIKAGIMEIADILVLNKADNPGVENTERALRANLELGYPNGHNRKAGHSEYLIEKSENRDRWIPPVIKTVATRGTGIGELCEVIFTHKDNLAASGRMQMREKERLATEFDHQLKLSLFENWKNNRTPQDIAKVLEDVYERRCSPSKAVERLLAC